MPTIETIVREGGDVLITLRLPASVVDGPDGKRKQKDALLKDLKKALKEVGP